MGRNDEKRLACSRNLNVEILWFYGSWCLLVADNKWIISVHWILCSHHLYMILMEVKWSWRYTNLRLRPAIWSLAEQNNSFLIHETMKILHNIFMVSWIRKELHCSAGNKIAGRNLKFLTCVQLRRHLCYFRQILKFQKESSFWRCI